MSEHHATIRWSRGSGEFLHESYSRDHVWEFENGIEIEASAAPGFLGSPDRIDPEEGFVAALSSCHMLTFLAIAARRRLVVDSYRDAAVGFLDKNDEGKLAVTRVVLRPKIEFAEGAVLPAEELDKLHQKAHSHCFIANSVRTSISIESG